MIVFVVMKSGVLMLLSLEYIFRLASFKVFKDKNFPDYLKKQNKLYRYSFR